jgi:hypothetical protein
MEIFSLEKLREILTATQTLQEGCVVGLENAPPPDI